MNLVLTKSANFSNMILRLKQNVVKGGYEMAIQLKAARVNAGFTQDYVCKALKISKTTITNYERYRTKPDIDMAKKLADLYGMNIEDIVWSL